MLCRHSTLLACPDRTVGRRVGPAPFWASPQSWPSIRRRNAYQVILFGLFALRGHHSTPFANPKLTDLRTVFEDGELHISVEKLASWLPNSDGVIAHASHLTRRQRSHASPSTRCVCAS